jgi:hypothetical protein
MRGGRVGFFERVWRRFADDDAARRAELDGDLARAARLWASVGANDEAARVMILRGDGEADPSLRLPHYAQAATVATPGSEQARTARVKRAKLTVLLAQGATLSAARRRDVLDAAHDLEELGDPGAAAEAYALAGDTEGEARALTDGGEVDRLDELLESDHARTKDARRSSDVLAEVDARIAGGERRDALMLAERLPEDALARERAVRLRGARIEGPIVRVRLGGRPLAVVLGDEVVIGRSEGSITVPSSVLSRRHVRVRREGGAAVVEDLGSHNGTQLRGIRLAHPLPVAEDGLALTLGGEVALALSPSTDLDGATLVTVAGSAYLAPLGPARLGSPGWQLVTGPDGWVELLTSPGSPAFAGALALGARVTLLRGDAFSTTRGGDVVLAIEG